MAKIMLIDDEAETLETHEEFLKDDHIVYSFKDGNEALSQISKIMPDLILLDIEMPFIDGFRVLEALQEITGFEETPVIGVTGQKGKATVLKFIGKGGAAYLTKPVGKQALLAKVKEVLEQDQIKKMKQKVLLVDDELESLLVTKAVLQEHYDVMALNSSKMAFQYLHKYVPDLIVLDYHMPLYDGKTLYQMIRKMDKCSKVPVIYYTGENLPTLIKEASPLPDGVVLKASGKDALLSKIESLIKLNKQESDDVNNETDETSESSEIPETSETPAVKSNEEEG